MLSDVPVGKWQKDYERLICQKRLHMRRPRCPICRLSSPKLAFLHVPSFIVTHHAPSLHSAGNAANSIFRRVPGVCSYDLGYKISFSRERQMLFPLHLECLNSPSASTSQRVQLPFISGTGLVTSLTGKQTLELEPGTTVQHKFRYFGSA